MVVTLPERFRFSNIEFLFKLGLFTRMCRAFCQENHVFEACVAKAQHLAVTDPVCGAGQHEPPETVRQAERVDDWLPICHFEASRQNALARWLSDQAELREYRQR